MNNFSLSIIADKKIRRQIHLVERIMQSPYPIALEEIAIEFDVSVRTLERDIAEIGNIDKEFVVQHKAVGYEIENTALIDDLLLDISEQSPLFVIIQNMYEEIYLTIDEWADDLFLSSSALYRYLSSLKNILKDFNLTLSLTPVKIEGEEVDIRYFYFYFFYSTNDISPKYRPGQELFDIFQANYDFFIQNTDISVSLQHRSILYWTMIVNKRIEHEHYITIPDEVKVKQQQSLTYKYIEKLAHEILITTSTTDIPVDETVFLDMLLLDNYMYREGVAGPIEERLYPFLTKDLHLFVNDFFAKENLAKPSDATLYIFIFYIRNILLLTQLTPLFQKNFFEVNQFVKTMHYPMFKKWMAAISASEIADFKKIKYTEDVCVNLTMFTLYAKNKDVSSMPHILFSFDGKTAYLNYLHMFVENFMGGNTEVTFSYNKHITNELANSLGVDLIVKNYKETSENFDCQTYNTSRHPTTKDWDNIYHLILAMQST
ncbi:HTH domain-containing protein [Listeria booriae]|uniref:helix-turn-helix domain-containing protein n=1 Tax=Listeria booriae TaxID=1552123 RepID=UPI001629A6FC|nr:helix-turn-helix domain-containing protein [Listeria booriae]MBC1553887.1 HTH domain-containing protein [Listeria booriae]MBC2080365.1 HTH domain-containing protein [Listeria booriae]MBC2188333.1 HTH domain-containing protein [Listeria booriae]